MNKNNKTLKDFSKYCTEHPSERFWQALRNWSGALKIYYEMEDKNLDAIIIEDTFYWEEKRFQ